MKSLVFLPFAFLAGQHGFAIFAPYLAVFITIVAVVRRFQRAAAAVPAAA